MGGKFGRIDCLHICDNLGDHMIGHVYAKFSDEEEASDAMGIMNGRYYDGRRMDVEFSPVTDFREARCRDFDEDTCARGGFCNFMHIKHVPPELIRSLEEDVDEERRREAAARAKANRARSHSSGSYSSRSSNSSRSSKEGRTSSSRTSKEGRKQYRSKRRKAGAGSRSLSRSRS